MKKQKREEKYVYQGLGFPVVLLHVPMIEIRGIWTPDINYNLLQKAVLLALAHYSSTLTGNHIRFIRSWFELTLAGFGGLFGVTHAAVLKWEASGNRGAKISLTTEREIRALILDKILKRAEDFRQAFRNIHQIDFKGAREVLEVDAQRELMAIR